MKKTILSGILLLVFSFLLCGCSLVSASRSEPVTGTGFYFDTVVTLTLYDADESLIQECFAQMADYEALLSRTREGSDVWNINHSQGQTAEVSPITASLLETALSYAELSNGAFDPTIAPLTDLWDFQGEGTHSLPAESDLEEALRHVGYEKVHLNGTSVTLTDPETAIDLGGIAKGYIADLLKEFLLSRGITSGLIDLGGNLLTIGSKPDGSPWKLGIRKPFSQTASELCAAVSITDDSLVTSGSYERCFELDGTRYHHILEKTTGYPANTGLTSVSITSHFSVDCDALSTVCFLLGLEDGMQLIESLENTEALFITEDGTLHRSSGFPES